MTRQAFRSLGGVLQPGIWVHRPMPTYDVSSGNVVAPAPALYEVSVLVSRYRRDEIDGVRILATDRCLCVYQAISTDSPAVTPAVPVGLLVQPSVRDQVEVAGTVWHLLTVEQDAAGLVWICQGRCEGEQP